MTEKEQHCLEIGKVNVEIEDKYLKMNHAKITKFLKNNGDLVQELVQEDSVCVCCNSGDDEETNKIVYCGKCKRGIHQNCYQIGELPAGEWICSSCEIFGKTQSEKVRCVLCPFSGGIMKCINIVCYDEKMREINPEGYGQPEEQYFKIMEQYLDEDKFKTTRERKEQVEHLKKKHCLKIGAGCNDNNSLFPSEDKNLTNVKIEKKETKIRQEVLGNNYLDRDADIEDLESKFGFFGPFYSWVHVSCAVFFPEVYFTPGNLLKIGKMHEDQFRRPCYICDENGRNPLDNGACLKCADPYCDRYFHVECARLCRNKMKILEMLKTGNTYHKTEIFC